MQRLLDTADALYDRATFGIAHLPLSCRPGIYAARALYAEIGRELETRWARFHLKSAQWSRPSRKLAVLTRMLVLLETENGLQHRMLGPIAQLDEIQFLD